MIYKHEDGRRLSIPHHAGEEIGPGLLTKITQTRARSYPLKSGVQQNLKGFVYKKSVAFLCITLLALTASLRNRKQALHPRAEDHGIALFSINSFASTQ